MAETKLNMQLLLRRDQEFASSYKLAAGEPGFEIGTNTLKIGDGVKTWAELPIANLAAIEALIKVVDDKVKALDSTYATDQALADGLALKADKATYEAYVEAHKNDYTNAQVDAKVKVVDDKFASYRTSAAQDTIDNGIKGRLDALEAVDHEHANKALLDTYTQTEANLADAVARKHAHSFNEAELNKIVEGDVAKWNGVAADHLKAADKTALESKIAEAKKAGTDADTYIKAYEVTNDARVKAVEDDIAEIVDGTNGILAQAKSYSDGKLSTARSEISAEIDADVKVVADDLAGYKTSNNQALAGVKATAEAAATKVYTDAELAKKVDKVDGYSLVSNTEIERLSKVDNYNDAEVRGLVGDNAKAIEDLEGYVGTFTHATAKTVIEYVDAKTHGIASSGEMSALGDRVTTAEGKIAVLESASATHATKTELNNVDAKFANYKTAAAQKTIDDEQDRRLGVIEGDYLKAADIADFETKANVKKVADDLAAYVEDNDDEVAAVRVIAEAARTESEVNSQIDTKISALKLAETYEAIGAENRAKAYADSLITDANLDQYTTEQEVKDIVDGVIAGAVDGDTITGLANLVEYLHTHGGEAKDMAAAIDVLEGKVETIEGKPAYGITAAQISNWNNEVGAKALAETKLNAATFTEYSNAHASDYTNKQIDDAIDADVAALKTELEGKINAVNTGIMSVEAGNDIVVTPGANGKVTVAHETFTTGAYAKNPAESDKTGDVYLMTGVTVDNGHVTGANVQSLANALMGMSFIIDGGSSAN